jgi:hypothetical protein
VAAQEEQPPPYVRPSPIPLFFQVQQQSLEDKKLEKLFSDSKRQALQLSVALIQKQVSHPVDPWDKFVTSEVAGSYYAVARGKKIDSFGIYAHVNKFLFEVNGVVGFRFKVCGSNSEAHLRLKKIGSRTLGRRSDRSPSLVPRRGYITPPPPEEKRNDISKASMLVLGGRSAIRDQSKGKEGKLFGYSVLDMVKLINCLIPDPERLPDTTSKHFTEQMA